ncbi:MAG: lysophospholipid acyltransferase family protein [Ilumatobacteraceae bacterium]
MPHRPSRLLDNVVARSVLSVWSWLVLGVTVIVWVPMVAAVRLCTPFDKGHYAAGLLWRKLAVVNQLLNPLWTFHTSGLEIDDPRRPYVVVANHESFVDILLISHLPWEMKWLAKDAFFRYPLVGWLMRMAGDVRIVRGQRASADLALEQCRDRLDRKVSVMIFPEGTRSRDGGLGQFKTGAFRLAIETGAPILPLAVHGTRGALRSGDWRFGVVDAEVRVLEPIETEGMTLDDLPILRDKVRSRIADELALMQTT